MTESLQENKGGLDNKNLVQDKLCLSPEEVEEIIGKMKLFVLPDHQDPSQRFIIEDTWKKITERIRANGIKL